MTNETKWEERYDTLLLYVLHMDISFFFSYPTDQGIKLFIE